MKKYLVLVDYGTEGWSIFHDSDDWEDAVEMYINAEITGNQRLIVQNVDVQNILNKSKPAEFEPK